MLDATDVGLSVERLERIPSPVRLPEDWRPDTERPVPLKSCMDDMRHYTRYLYRTRALLHVSASLPALGRAAGQHLIFTKDVSREGLAFYHAEQLFPRERMQVWLPGQQLQRVRITRCRRLNERCYEIGARFE